MNPPEFEEAKEVIHAIKCPHINTPIKRAFILGISKTAQDHENELSNPDSAVQAEIGKKYQEAYKETIITYCSDELPRHLRRKIPARDINRVVSEVVAEVNKLFDALEKRKRP